jgi:hypothetical protein
MSDIDLAAAPRDSILKLYELISRHSATTHRVGRDSYNVRCPSLGHPEKDGSRDRHPSCSLSGSNNTWYCHSCKAHGGLLELALTSGAGASMREGTSERHKAFLWVASALRLERPADLLDQPPLRQRDSVRDVEPNEVIATYTYCDEDGVPLYRELRYARKDFRMQTFARNRWVYGFKSDRMVLYRLREVLAAVAAGRAVVMVEGHGKADVLAELGFGATTLPFGANYTKHGTSWMDPLRGAIVLVVSDADVPGRAMAARRARELAPIAKRVAVCDLFPERASGGYDIKDLIHEMRESGIPDDDIADALKRRLRACAAPASAPATLAS